MTTAPVTSHTRTAADSRLSGLKGRVTRLYNYQWTGAPRSARFDAGLVNVDGTARKAYTVFKRQAKKYAR